MCPAFGSSCSFLCNVKGCKNKGNPVKTIENILNMHGKPLLHWRRDDTTIFRITTPLTGRKPEDFQTTQGILVNRAEKFLLPQKIASAWLATSYNILQLLQDAARLCPPRDGCFWKVESHEPVTTCMSCSL